MIFVTVGSLPFTRLIKKMDEFAAQTDEEIVMQIADDTYLPKNTVFFDFGSFDTMRELSKSARVVVCHGGVGSILSALEQGTNVIVVPRKKAYGELIDNHQTELITRLAGEKKIVDVDDLDDLPAELRVKRSQIQSFEIDKRLKNFLCGYVSDLEPQIEKGRRH